jgi:hypothetical protein
MIAMRFRLRLLAPLLAVPVLLAPAPAAARPIKNLWATVNRCDTPSSPNTIGVRASMPGTKYRSRLYMRFRIQFWSEMRQSFVATDSSTRWLRVGTGRAAATQSGFSFRFDDPPEGEQFVLRGVVQYRYTALRRRRDGTGGRRWRVVKQYERLTRSGQPNVQSADPPGASFSMCIVRRETGEGRL